MSPAPSDARMGGGAGVGLDHADRTVDRDRVQTCWRPVATRQPQMFVVGRTTKSLQMSRLDEIVAANVRRLREDNKWKPSTLASEMGLPKHVVYDMERPRKGQQQRGFSWTVFVNMFF
jgi:hypothetical protein